MTDNNVYTKHCKRSNVPPPSSGGYSFQIILHIIDFIALLGVEINNAHYDTLFVWIDQKIMKLDPFEDTYPEIWKLH